MTEVTMRDMQEMMTISDDDIDNDDKIITVNAFQHRLGMC